MVLAVYFFFYVYRLCCWLLYNPTPVQKFYPLFSSLFFYAWGEPVYSFTDVFFGGGKLYPGAALAGAERNSNARSVLWAVFVNVGLCFL